MPSRVLLKTPADIEGIKASAEVNVGVLDYVGEHIKAGVTTADINRWVEEYLVAHDAVSADLNYEGYPFSVCTSVNDVICHGFPDENEVLHDGDSIQYVELNTLYVYPQPVFADARQRQAYNRLVANIKKVLPIAKEVNAIIIETYEFLQTLPNKKAKDEHMQRVERSIRKEYTPRMKKLTYSQGKLLIKLVYRECNSSSYQLIQAFLGPIRAGFYQAFAALFGASLTKKSDAEGVDKYTERIVRQVEAGQL